MKPTKLSEFKVPARNLAELAWGRGGTHSYPTSRRGVYYYSCSGHGGYVVDSRALTPSEQEVIDKFKAAWPLRLLIQQRNGSSYVIGVNCVYFQSTGPYRQKSYRYCPSLGSIEWVDLPVYLFEEDCDWAILEHLTGIRCLEPSIAKYHKDNPDCTREVFERWCKPIS